MVVPPYFIQKQAPVAFHIWRDRDLSLLFPGAGGTEGPRYLTRGLLKAQFTAGTAGTKCLGKLVFSQLTVHSQVLRML